MLPLKRTLVCPSAKLLLQSSKLIYFLVLLLYLPISQKACQVLQRRLSAAMAGKHMPE